MQSLAPDIPKNVVKNATFINLFLAGGLSIFDVKKLLQVQEWLVERAGV